MTPERLLGLVKQEVEARGFELVDFRQAGSPGRPVLQIRADRPTSEPGAGITTDECATLSRALERRLEDAGAVGTTYVLEVSSPGIERPVRFIEHWRSLVGRRVRVRAAGIPGRSEAVIAAVPDQETVELRLPDESLVRVALKDVKDAVLVYDWPAAGLKKGQRR